MAREWDGWSEWVVLESTPIILHNSQCRLDRWRQMEAEMGEGVERVEESELILPIPPEGTESAWSAKRHVDPV